MTKHPEPFSDELISAYLDGELSDAESDQVEQSLTDPKYQRMLDELRQLRDGLRSLPKHTLDGSFSDRVLEQALERTGDSKPTHAPMTGPDRPRRGFGRGLVWSALTIAAAILLMLKTKNEPTDETAPQLAGVERSSSGRVGDSGKAVDAAAAVESNSIRDWHDDGTISPLPSTTTRAPDLRVDFGGVDDDAMAETPKFLDGKKDVADNLRYYSVELAQDASVQDLQELFKTVSVESREVRLSASLELGTRRNLPMQQSEGQWLEVEAPPLQLEQIVDGIRRQKRKFRINETQRSLGGALGVVGEVTEDLSLESKRRSAVAFAADSKQNSEFYLYVDLDKAETVDDKVGLKSRAFAELSDITTGGVKDALAKDEADSDQVAASNDIAKNDADSQGIARGGFKQPSTLKMNSGGRAVQIPGSSKEPAKESRLLKQRIDPNLGDVKELAQKGKVSRAYFFVQRKEAASGASGEKADEAKSEASDVEKPDEKSPSP